MHKYQVWYDSYHTFFDQIFLWVFFTVRSITVLIAILQLSSVMVSTVRSWGCHLGGYVGGAYVGCVINGADDFL